MAAKRHLHNTDFVKFLLSLSTWNSNRYDDSGYAPLHRCTEKLYNNTIRLLCESRRVDIELPTQSGLIYSSKDMMHHHTNICSFF
jgi:hypothetical protein